MEDKAEPLAAQQGDLPIAKPRQVHTVDVDLTRGRSVEAAQQIEHCRLARTRTPSQCHKLTHGDGQRDAGNGMDFTLSGRVGPPNIACLKKRPGHCCLHHLAACG